MALDFPTSPTTGQKYPASPVSGVPTYTWDGEKWVVNTSAIGGTTILMSDTPPVGAAVGTLWWESDSGFLFVLYNDGTSTQWVTAGAPQPDLTGLGLVHYDVVQTLTAAQQLQARQNISATSVEALAYNGLQINGSMEVDQINSGAAFTIPAVSAGGKLFDCWSYTNNAPTTAAYTIQQTASVFPGFNKEMKVTVTAAQPSPGASTTLDISNSIEGFRIARLSPGTANAQTLTFAFWVKSSIAGTMPVYVCNAAINSVVQSNITITAANVAQYVTATIQLPTSGTWAIDNTLGMIVLIRPMISTFNIAATVGNTFEITGLVVLPGAQAPTAAQSQFIMRPYSQELEICRRYYQTIIPDIRFYAPSSFGYSEYVLTLAPTMRTQPTITNIVVGTSAACASFVVTALSASQARPTFTINATGDAYANGYVFSCDARL